MTFYRLKCFVSICFCFGSVAEKSAGEIKRIFSVWQPEIYFTGKNRCNIFAFDAFWLRIYLFWTSALVKNLQSSCHPMYICTMPRTETTPIPKRNSPFLFSFACILHNYIQNIGFFICLEFSNRFWTYFLR